MSTEILEAEIVAPLVKFAGTTGLEKPTTETLVEAFRPVFLKARTAIGAAAGVAESVKDATCVTEIKKSRACRLAIRAVRLEGEAIHKAQKESALRFGRAVDGFRNILLADLEPVEKSLQDAEDTAERAEAARKVALKATREAELLPLLDTPPLGDLSTLSEAGYVKMLEDARFLRQARIDAAAKAEADRIAKEKADAEERERIRLENEKLKREAEKAEAARVAAEAKAAEERRKAEADAKAEREAAEKKLAEERAEAARVAAEIKAKADAAAKVAAEKAAKEREAAEAKAKAEREAIEAKAKADAEIAAREAAALKAELAARAEAEARTKAKADADAKAAALAARKAAAAPDKAKLLKLATDIAEMELPSFDDEAISDAVRAKVKELASWCAAQSERLP